MKWNHFLPCLLLLLLSYSFHHHAIAKLGNLGKLLKGDSGQRRYSPLRDETLEESSSQETKSSSGKGFLSTILPKFKGKSKAVSSTRNPQPDPELERWVNMIYQTQGTNAFLMNLKLDPKPPESFEALSKEIKSVNRLIKQFENDMKKRPNRLLSGSMRELIEQVMGQLSLLKGTNDEELSKIAICAKALADITAAKQPTTYQITELESTSLKYIMVVWDNYIQPSQNERVNSFFENLRILWTSKV
ncbi:hypothetical protein PGT21_028406 [Puccinia graminis f. sp. tritici]|uniref:Uncharacterized protein n=2 Tax=Puccinia graminis f. sp. tritici TaxID=56615 RepID=A0A5B0NQJ1_PUCGR|nr:hypothetical protein PGT21_028406 [Puccinia graminis f. sp. tritici]